MTIKWETLKTADTLEQEKLEALAAQVRVERDKRIAATDFYMLQDAPPAPTGLAEYRKALRDITKQAGFPESVEWPELVLSDVPSRVTRRQAMTVLLTEGKLSEIEQAIAAIEDEQAKAVAEIFWQESLHFERNNPLMNQLATAIGMSQEQLDQMFIQAAAL